MPTGKIYNQEAEEALMACALLFPQTVGDVEHFFQADHFHLEHLREAWGVVEAEVKAGRTADILVVAEKAGPKLSEAGGLAYLTKLISQVPDSMNGAAYARLVTDDWKRRQLAQVGQAAMQMAYTSARDKTDPTDALAAVGSALKEMEAVATESSIVLQADSFQEFYQEEADFVNAGAQPNRVSTGYPFLDEKLGGWMRGVLNVVHGWAGFGKTSLLAQGSFNQARAGLKVGVFQLEENHREWQRLGRNALMGIDPQYRYLKSQGKREVDIARAREDDLVRLQEEWAPIATTLPMAYSKSGFIGVDALAREARQMARALGGLDVIYIDNMNYIAKQGGNESYAIGMAAMQLASLGKELNAAVVLIVHDNKQAGEDDEAPTLNQIYMSKAIEHTARIVVVNHPDVKADNFRSALAGWKERFETWMPVPYLLGIQKNNKGLTGNVQSEFIPAFQRHQAREMRR